MVGRPYLLLWTDKHVLKHYLPITSFAGDNNMSVQNRKNEICTLFLRTWGTGCRGVGATEEQGQERQ